jgi:hypothetical protein
MQIEQPQALITIRTDLAAIFVSLELSRSNWLITSLWPGGGEKMSKYSIRGGDSAELLERFAQLREKAQIRAGKRFPIIVIQEAGLDGFWIHRVLQGAGIESYVVDPASVATSRRRRQAKTDRLDGETLLRTLLAYKRGYRRRARRTQPGTDQPAQPLSRPSVGDARRYGGVAHPQTQERQLLQPPGGFQRATIRFLWRKTTYRSGYSRVAS